MTPETPHDGHTDQLAYGRYDEGERRQSGRSGREKGCWVYIPAAELRKAGFGPDDPAPFYRTWGDRRGSVVVRLYRQR